MLKQPCKRYPPVGASQSIISPATKTPGNFRSIIESSISFQAIPPADEIASAIGRGPRPIAEAISSAGGIAWQEIDDSMMLRKLPGVFVAGEMIDWEAPTGGYLLQGCFSTGHRAGQNAARFATARSASPE